MSEDKEVSPSKGRRPSRRTMLRLGLLAIPATQMPLGFVPRAAAQGTKLGANLIGKLEGAEVVTDPALFPKSFKEAPQLAELVKAGKLPPVQERIGQDPLVVKPLREIGKYGGTWRRGFTGPFDTSNGHRVAQNDKLLYYDYTGTKLVPNIARAWEVSPDGKVTTLLLRRGMKWSDGHPFTADDFVFWYQDVYQNKDLVPTPLSVMTIGGKPIAIEKIDAATIRFVSPEPYYALPTVLASVWGIGHHARLGRSALGGFAPAHYLKQFHPKYVSKDDLAKKVAELKFDSWVTMFKSKNDACRNVDLPVVTPWKTTSPLTTPTWILERNPYSVWVDTDGNQLPYIDRIRMTLGENLEVINLRAIAGEYDSQARHIDISKLPVLLENQQKGGYRVYLDPSDQGADVGLFCNQSYDKDPEIAKWLGTREFRIALSHGIDRAQINETFLLGLGQTGSAAPGERTLYYPGPEYKTLHTAYDVKKANEMLDKLGLTKKDGEGYRLRADGKGRLRLSLTTYLGFLPFTQIARDDDRAVEEDRHPGRDPGDGARRGDGEGANQRAPDLLRDPVGRRQHLRAHPPHLSRRRREPDGAALRPLVLERGGQGQDTAPAHARADGEVPQVIQREGPGADAHGQGRVEDRAGRAVDDPRRVQLARLAGRAGHQDEHGQYPRAALEQRGQRQPAHRPHGDLVLQVARARIRAHLLRWRPRPHGSTYRDYASPCGLSGAASQLDPSPRSSRVSPTGS